MSRAIDAVAVPVGGANFGSLAQASRRLGVTLRFSSDPDCIAAATHVILPGVGAAGPAMAALRSRGLDRIIAELRQPVLGICLGMQLLFEHSAEGDCDMLGLIPGNVMRLTPAPTWPHMGWNTVEPALDGHALFKGIGADDWFYFVHGYAANVGDHAVASCRFGQSFCAAVSRGNLHGVQFHPEKSSSAGRTVLANFFAL